MRPAAWPGASCLGPGPGTAGFSTLTPGPDPDDRLGGPPPVLPAGPDSTPTPCARRSAGAEADGYQVVTVALLGHKADLGLMALGPDVWRLRRLQTEAAGAGLVTG